MRRTPLRGFFGHAARPCRARSALGNDRGHPGESIARRNAPNHRSKDQGEAVPDTNQATPRSQFVTIVAWIFIVLGGFATFISLLQNVLINTVFPIDQMQDQIAQSPSPMPPMFHLMFDNIRLFFFAFLVVTLTTFVAAIGLLRRRNWARLLFIAILGLGIVWNLVGIVLQQMMVSQMLSFQPPAPPDFEAQMQGMMLATRVFSAIFAIGFSVLFGWMIKRLVAPGVVAEFE